MKNKKRIDMMVALIFAIFTITFLILFRTNQDFFNWTFERHHNVLSWYVRPLFLIPFCFFAYKRSLAGISATIFLQFTSMFWFPKPETTNELVNQFLAMEMVYLQGELNFSLISQTLLIPISFIALGVVLWKRNLKLGISVVILMTIGKMIWSVVQGGESGTSIFIPAMLGLIICIGAIAFGFKRLEKKAKQ
ncbi:hypothetical protein [Cytobacillus sp. IB215665]|uniref:hypothetical protein n=1 Tax=Cytobacillus sp. IB215665 TaxID=3097357 RepID=UPI002A0E5254|nr:hypothetical protein [Cytobacillus sp. IB215665]MDX8367946.1 hypothetical protein [Cytobacillus sp. IB215665]